MSPKCPPVRGPAGARSQYSLSRAQSTTNTHAANIRGNHSQMFAQQAFVPLNGHNTVADPHTAPAYSPLSPAPCPANTQAPGPAAGCQGQAGTAPPPGFPGPALSGWAIHRPSAMKQTQWERGFWNMEPTPGHPRTEVSTQRHSWSVFHGCKLGTGVDIRNLSHLSGQSRCLKPKRPPLVPSRTHTAVESPGKTSLIYHPPHSSRPCTSHGDC